MSQIDILRIYISSGHNFWGRRVEPGDHPTQYVGSVECVAGKGLEGDRFFDFKPEKYDNGYEGQVTFFAWETYEHLCEKLGVFDKDPGVFRRNIITKGVDLNALIDREFEIQGIRFLGTQEATPCAWMDEAFAPGALLALAGFGGLRAKILNSGTLRVAGN